MTNSFERLQWGEVELDDAQPIYYSNEKVICGLEWSFLCTVTWEKAGSGVESELVIIAEATH